MVKLGLLIRVEAKAGQEAELAAFLSDALALGDQEATTPVWFALKFGTASFGIFDAFEDGRGREAHLAGPIAAALMAHAAKLLARPPSIEPVEVVAVKSCAI